MAQLSQLEIVGKLSPCSVTVRVRNQVIGADVRLFVNSQPVGGGGTATWTNQAFKVPMNVNLNPGDQVTATQHLSGFADSLPSDPVNVDSQPTAQDLANGQFLTPIHDCASCVWLVGLFPGATVEVFSGPESLGKAQVGEDGQVQLDLNRSLTTKDVLSARQTACPPQNIQSANPIAGSPVQPLPPLQALAIEIPLTCAQYIHLTNIVEGAEITLSRNNNLVKKFNSAIPSFFFFPIDKLKAGDSIQAQQGFTCSRHRRPIGPQSSAPVQDAVPSPPAIKPPLCAGKKSVNVSGLKPGATVELKLGDNVFTFGASSPFLMVPVLPLAEGMGVSARQNLCGEDPATWSLWSMAQTVGTNVPVAPTLQLPTDKATGVTTNHPSLTWQDPGGQCNYATLFDVKLATDPTVVKGSLANKIVQNLTGVNAPKVKTQTLLPNTTYYWQVRGHKGSKTGPWSVVFSFVTAQPTAGGSDPGSKDPGPEKKTWCFKENCCPYYKAVAKQFGTQFEAYEAAVAAAPATCYIDPNPVNCNFQPGACDQNDP